jgi:hypothetical protein
MDKCLLFETRERFDKDIVNLFNVRDIFDGIHPFFVVVMKEMILDIDIFKLLIIRFTFCD